MLERWNCRLALDYKTLLACLTRMELSDRDPGGLSGCEMIGQARILADNLLTGVPGDGLSC